MIFLKSLEYVLQVFLLQNFVFNSIKFFVIVCETC